MTSSKLQELADAVFVAWALAQRHFWDRYSGPWRDPETQEMINGLADLERVWRRLDYLASMARDPETGPS